MQSKISRKYLTFYPYISFTYKTKQNKFYIIYTIWNDENRTSQPNDTNIKHTLTWQIRQNVYTHIHLYIKTTIWECQSKTYWDLLMKMNLKQAASFELKLNSFELHCIALFTMEFRWLKQCTVASLLSLNQPGWCMLYASMKPIDEFMKLAKMPFPFRITRSTSLFQMECKECAHFTNSTGLNWVTNFPFQWHCNGIKSKTILFASSQWGHSEWNQNDLYEIIMVEAVLIANAIKILIEFNFVNVLLVQSKLIRQ